MTRRLRRNHRPALKAKVALAASRGGKTMSEPPGGLELEALVDWL